MTAPPAPCGTPGAAQRHRKRGEPLCDSCRMASALYMEWHRWEKGEPLRARENRNTLRRQRALTILARRHRAELDAIVDALITQDRAQAAP